MSIPHPTRSFLYSLLAFWFVVVAPLTGQDLNAAKAAFDAQDFATCVQQVEAFHEAQKPSPESWLLYGNAQAMLDDAPAAMLAYRRALLLAPNLHEARQNLKYLNRKNGVPDPQPATGFLAFLDAVPPPVFWLAGSCGLWLGVFGLLAFLGILSSGRSAWAFAALVLGSSAAILSFSAAYAQHVFSQSDGTGSAKIWKPDAQLTRTSALHAEPARRSKAIVESLPAGTPIRILQASGWTYAEVPAGPNASPLRGWLENASWTRIQE